MNRIMAASLTCFIFILQLSPMARPTGHFITHDKQNTCIQSLQSSTSLVAKSIFRLNKELREYSSSKPAPKHLIVLPNYDLKALGVQSLDFSFYELRSMWTLLNAIATQTRVTFITTSKISPSLIDYIMTLSPLQPMNWRDRIEIFHLKRTRDSLAESLLDQPQLLAELQSKISESEATVLLPFRSDQIENKVAHALNVPILGPKGDLHQLTSKSGNKNIFRKAKIMSPESIENLHSPFEIAQAIERIWTHQTSRSNDISVILKINEGALGQGNAYLKIPALESSSPEERLNFILASLNHIEPVNTKLPTQDFLKSFNANGGIVELVVDRIESSPSGQGLISPTGEIEILSTHEQILDSVYHQIFIGSTFPANQSYRSKIQEALQSIGKELFKEGILGYFSVDFLVTEGTQDLLALEINLRQSGTTHPFQLVKFATNGVYNKTTGNLENDHNLPIYYSSSDSHSFLHWQGKSITEVQALLKANHLAFSNKSEFPHGIILVMPSEVTSSGKIGMISVAKSALQAEQNLNTAIELLAKPIE